MNRRVASSGLLSGRREAERGHVAAGIRRLAGPYAHAARLCRGYRASHARRDSPDGLWTGSWTGRRADWVHSGFRERSGGLSVQAERSGRRAVLLVMNRSSVRFRQAAPRSGATSRFPGVPWQRLPQQPCPLLPGAGGRLGGGLVESPDIGAVRIGTDESG